MCRVKCDTVCYLPSIKLHLHDLTVPNIAYVHEQGVKSHLKVKARKTFFPFAVFNNREREKKK